MLANSTLLNDMMAMKRGLERVWHVWELCIQLLPSSTFAELSRARMKSHDLMICRDLLDPHGKEAVSGRKQSWINTSYLLLSLTASCDSEQKPDSPRSYNLCFSLEGVVKGTRLRSDLVTETSLYNGSVLLLWGQWMLFVISPAVGVVIVLLITFKNSSGQ